MNVPGYDIRLSRRSELRALQQVERRASELLVSSAPAGSALEPREPHSLDALLAASDGGRLWVAAHPDGELVAWALWSEVGLFAHLEQLEVLPAQRRQGLGGALLENVCSWASSRGFSAVTHVSSGASAGSHAFLLRRGFVELPAAELPPELLEPLRRERRQRPSAEPFTLLQREV